MIVRLLKLALILPMILVVFHTGFSQTVTIKDKITHEVLEMVSLVSKYPKASASTNSKGQAPISSFKGADRIEISLLGHQLMVKSYAQIASEKFVLYLQPSNLKLGEVVVSATKWKQTSTEIPSKIISISHKEMAIQNPQTAADLLGITGKVYIQKSQQAGGSPMIRGFATNRLLYTIDGVRMNTAIFRAGNIQNVISLDPFATEHTEVLFGPGSVIYGSDAIGGVLNFQTLSPQFSLDNKLLSGGSVEARYSSANQEKTAHFDLNFGKEKWATTTSVSFFNYGHLKMGKNGPDDYLKLFVVETKDAVDRVLENKNPQIQDPSAYSQINLMQKLRYKPNEKFDFQYGFHYSQTSEYARYDRHNRMKNGLPRYAEWNYGPQIWLMNNLSFNYENEVLFFDEVSLRLAHQNFEESRISRDLNRPNREIRTEKVGAYSVNLDFSKTLAQKNQLIYGFEYVFNAVSSQGIDENIVTGFQENGPSRYPQSNWSSLAFYLNNQYKFSERFLLQAGFRYNRFLLIANFDGTFYPFPFKESRMNNGAPTGSIGAVFRPASDWVISFNLASAFRSPNVDDMGKVFDPAPGNVVVPNPDIKPEYAYNADINLAKVFGDAVKIDLSAFYTLLQDAMVVRDFSMNGKDSIVYDGEMSKVQSVQNAARATVYGLQAGLEFKFSSSLGLSTDLNYQKGEEELDDGSLSPLRHAAPFFGALRINYQTKRLTLQLYAIFQAKRNFEELPQEEQTKTEIYALDENNHPYSPAWYTLNVKSIYRFNNHFSVMAGIENMTDQRYRPYSSGIAADGRNLVLSVSANF